VLKIFDFGIEFKQMKAGDDLVRQGDEQDDALYVVIHGRLRGTVNVGERSNKRQVQLVDEFSRGSLIGDAELLTGEPYRMTVRAMRHCTLARVPERVLACIVKRHPSVLSHLAVQVRSSQSPLCRIFYTDYHDFRSVVSKQGFLSVLYFKRQALQLEGLVDWGSPRPSCSFQSVGALIFRLI
jgi:CRP-like cAMP-binding protein